MIGWFKNRRPLAPTPVLRRTFDMALFDGPGAELNRALNAFWAGSGPHTTVPADADRQVKALEQRYGLRLPEEFRDYLLHAAPGAPYMDDDLIQWWSIAEVKNVPDECGKTPPGQINPAIEAEAGSYLMLATI